MDVKFEWTEEMSVHHNILDEQHKKLFEKINELLEAIVDGTAGDMIQELIDFFENYMNKHLIYEEQYLKDIGYPHTKEHHEQHQVFIKKYNELKKTCDCSKNNEDNHKIVFDIENFMGAWLTNHILVEDQKFAQYIQQRNKK